MCVSSKKPSKELKAATTILAPGVAGVYYGGKALKKDKKGDSPPGTTKPETAAITGRNKELAILTAKAKQKKRLALIGRRRTILTSDQGVLGFPNIERKRLLGQ